MTASEQIAVAAARERFNAMSPIQLLSIHDAQAAHYEAERRLSRWVQVLTDAGQIDLAVQIAEEARER